MATPKKSPETPMKEPAAKKRAPKVEIILDPDDKGNAIRRQSFAITLITQGDHKFYSLTIDSDILAKVCSVSTRDEDPLQGFQRHLDKKRAAEIAEYIDKGLGTIPNSVILSAQDKANLVYTSKNRSIKFNLVPGAFLILDGQHRIYGFSMATKHLRVPVIIYTGLSRKDESRLFIDINTKQRPVPSELLLDIKRLAEYETDDEKLSADVFNLFREDPSSALFGLLSPSKKLPGKISRSTFHPSVKQLIHLFNDKSADNIKFILGEYLHAFHLGLKSKKLDDTFTSPFVFKSILAFFGEILRSVTLKYGTDYTSDNFFEILKPVFDNLKSGPYRQASTSVKSLTALFKSALTKGFTV